MVAEEDWRELQLALVETRVMELDFCILLVVAIWGESMMFVAFILVEMVGGCTVVIVKYG